MIQKIKEMNFGAAKYVVMKELDERGPIGQLLLSYDPNIANNMMNICEWVDRSQIALEEHNDSGVDLRYLEEASCLLSQMSEKFPFLMLISSQLEWEIFLSGWMAIAGEMIAIGSYMIDRIQDDYLRDKTIQMVEGLKIVLAPTHQLIELGAGYQELLQASAEIVKELRHWRQSQPSAIRLSHAYLRSLGMMPREEGPHTEPASLHEIMNHEEPQPQPDDMPPPPPPHDDNHPPIFIGRD